MDDRRKYFEAYADEWDKMFTAEDLEILSFLIDSFGIKEGFKVADLGCGTGVLFDMLRRKVGKDGFVVGIDFCSKMVKKARQNFPFENVFEVDAEVENLPLKDNTFDCAITFASFAHFMDRKKVIREVSRILKKGGCFRIIHLLGSEELAEYHHQVGGPVAEDKLPDYDEMVRMLEEAGFGDIVIKMVRTDIKPSGRWGILMCWKKSMQILSLTLKS